MVKTNASFAMQLKSFSKELQLLDNYYTTVYIQTKGIVEFGMDESIIPNIETLIVGKNYPEAIQEIRSFLDTLAGRIKDIIDELSKRDEKVALSKELEQKIYKLSKDYGESKALLETQVEERCNAECHRIGQNILLLIGASTGGVLLCGDRPISEKLELATTYLANNPEVLSFVTDQGIQGFKAITSTSSAIADLRMKIENYAQDMTKRFYQFLVKITDFQVQIAATVVSIEGLKKHMEGLQQQLDDDGATRKRAAEWVNIKVTLLQMFQFFKNLDSQVVQRKISWQTPHMTMETSV